MYNFKWGNSVHTFWCNLVNTVAPLLPSPLAAPHHLGGRQGGGPVRGLLLVGPLLVQHLLPRACLGGVGPDVGNALVDVAAVGSLGGPRESLTRQNFEAKKKYCTYVRLIQMLN